LERRSSDCQCWHYYYYYYTGRNTGDHIHPSFDAAKWRKINHVHDISAQQLTAADAMPVYLATISCKGFELASNAKLLEFANTPSFVVYHSKCQIVLELFVQCLIYPFA